MTEAVEPKPESRSLHEPAVPAARTNQLGIGTLVADYKSLPKKLGGPVQQDLRIGITAGAFDLCHSGHLLFFAECKERVGKLIVCLHTNPQTDRPEKNVPCETTYERWVRLSACRHVDEIIPYDTERDLLNILSTVRWDLRFLDHTYEGKQYTGWDKGTHIFIPRHHDHSTTNLRQRIADG